MAEPPTNAKLAHHPQKFKLIARKNCRTLKAFSATLAVGDLPSLEQLRGSAAALKSVCEACTGADQKENETNLETVLGPLPGFLGQLKGNVEGAIGRTAEESSTEYEREDSEETLRDLLALSTEWHQRLQQHEDEALQLRKDWEEKYPARAAQEHELSIYVQSLLPLLEAPSARAISAAQWREAETSLASLQLYLLDNKISAEQVRSGGDKAIESVLRDLLCQLEQWDAEGLGFKKDKRVDIKLVEKIWGRADKIGSGLNYLLVLDARGDEVDGVKPTTRSVFLLKSAPPASFSFSASKDVWLVKKLSQGRARLTEIVLATDKPDIQRGDESRWSAAYRELEALDKLMKREVSPISQRAIQESRIGETIKLLCAKLESLHIPLNADEDESTFPLMYISWELAMRVGAALGVVPNGRPH